MKICEWYERLENDEEVIDLILSYECILAKYKPTYSRRLYCVRGGSSKALDHFWKSSGKDELKYMLECKYGLNGCNKKEVGALKIALHLLIHRMRNDAGIKDIENGQKTN